APVLALLDEVRRPRTPERDRVLPESRDGASRRRTGGLFCERPRLGRHFARSLVRVRSPAGEETRREATNGIVPLELASGPMRTIWNGSISFGLVNIPVGLALATTPKARQSDVSFRTLHRECRTPIRQKRWCPTHEREVGPEEIVKGWEVAKGEFVIVEDADLEAIAQHDDSRSIDITRFVPLSEVDPVYLDRTYYLAPAQAPAQRRPYVVLLQAMKDAGMGAIGRFVLRGSEYFALIRPKGDALVLETLFLAEDVRSQAEIDEAVAGTEVKKAELDLAQQVMD